MIQEGECHIEIQQGIGSFVKAEPPIPTDRQIEDVFPMWKFKVMPFIQRCCREEGLEAKDLTSSDFFRFGMKFMICESTKIL